MKIDLDTIMNLILVGSLSLSAGMCVPAKAQGSVEAPTYYDIAKTYSKNGIKDVLCIGEWKDICIQVDVKNRQIRLENGSGEALQVSSTFHGNQGDHVVQYHSYVKTIPKDESMYLGFSAKGNNSKCIFEDITFVYEGHIYGFNINNQTVQVPTGNVTRILLAGIKQSP